MILPPYHEGTHYRELAPRVGKFRWRFENLEWAVVRLPRREYPRMIFRDKYRRVWGRIFDSRLHIAPGYWWDGCSPKWHLPLLGWVGTPDVKPGTIFPSLVHDLLYQASGTQHFPMQRAEVDLFFRDLLIATGFPFAHLYHGAVRDYGGRSFGKPSALHSKLIP